MSVIPPSSTFQNSILEQGEEYFRLAGADLWIDPNVYVRKSLTSPDSDEQEEQPTARFVSIVSASGKDFQGEDLDQRGLEWDYFKKSGFFNWEHQPGPENVVGYPDNSVDCVTPCKDSEGNPATRVVGYLLLGTSKGRGIYETAMALQKSRSGRQIGCSVQGPVIERDPRNHKRVVRAQVRAIAVTTNPVRDTCRFEIVKSLTVLEGLYKGDGVAAVGTQTPPGMSGEDLSPLLTQSIDKRLTSAATYGNFRELLKRKFPKLSDEEVDRTAKNLHEYMVLQGFLCE